MGKLLRSFEFWAVAATAGTVVVCVLLIWGLKAYPRAVEPVVSERTLTVVSACVREARIGVTPLGNEVTLDTPDASALANCLAASGVLAVER